MEESLDWVDASDSLSDDVSVSPLESDEESDEEHDFEIEPSMTLYWRTAPDEPGRFVDKKTLFAPRSVEEVGGEKEGVVALPGEGGVPLVRFLDKRPEMKILLAAKNGFPYEIERRITKMVNRPHDTDLIGGEAVDAVVFFDFYAMNGFGLFVKDPLEDMQVAIAALRAELTPNAFFAKVFMEYPRDAWFPLVAFHLIGLDALNHSLPEGSVLSQRERRAWALNALTTGGEREKRLRFLARIIVYELVVDDLVPQLHAYALNWDVTQRHPYDVTGEYLQLARLLWETDVDVPMKRAPRLDVTDVMEEEAMQAKRKAIRPPHSTRSESSQEQRPHRKMDGDEKRASSKRRLDDFFNTGRKRDRSPERAPPLEIQPQRKRAREPEEVAASALLELDPMNLVTSRERVEQIEPPEAPPSSAGGMQTIRDVQSAATHADKIAALLNGSGYLLGKNALQGKHLQTLRPAEYLDDKIIAAYWDELMSFYGKDSTRFVETAFIDPGMLSLTGESARARFSTLCAQLSTKPIWVWPVQHLGARKDLSLLVIDWKEKTFSVFDVRNAKTAPTTKAVRAWLARVRDVVTDGTAYATALRAFTEGDQKKEFKSKNSMLPAIEVDAHDNGLFLCCFLYYYCRIRAATTKEEEEDRRFYLGKFTGAAFARERAEFSKQVRTVIAYELIYQRIVPALHTELELYQAGRSEGKELLLANDLRDLPLPRTMAPENPEGARLWFDGLPLSRIPPEIARELPLGFGSASSEVAKFMSVARGHPMEHVFSVRDVENQFDHELTGSDFSTLLPDYTGALSPQLSKAFTYRLDQYFGLIGKERLARVAIDPAQQRVLVLYGYEHVATKKESSAALVILLREKEARNRAYYEQEVVQQWPEYVRQPLELEISVLASNEKEATWNVANVLFMLPMLISSRHSFIDRFSPGDLVNKLGRRYRASPEARAEMSRLLIYTLLHGLVDSEELLARFIRDDGKETSFSETPEKERWKVLLSTDLRLDYRPENPTGLTAITSSPSMPPPPSRREIRASAPVAPKPVEKKDSAPTIAPLPREQEKKTATSTPSPVVVRRPNPPPPTKKKTATPRKRSGSGSKAKVETPSRVSILDLLGARKTKPQ